LTRARLIAGSLGLVQLGIGRPALLSQLLGTRFGRGGLRQYAAGGAQFRLSLFGLQFEIDLVESGERLARFQHRADLDKALEHLAANPKSQIAFDPWANSADERAIAGLGLVMDRGHEDRADWRGVLRRSVIAPGERQRQRASRREVRERVSKGVRGFTVLPHLTRRSTLETN
jgi:hypothetical protein